MKLITWPYYSAEYLRSQDFSENFLERFWAKVRITDTCWLWTAYTRPPPRNYGSINRWGSGHGIRAHVASWILHRGPLPHGFEVCHYCDNPPCVRPDHLWLGTHQQNMDDMVAKGRSRSLQGEASPNAKLTWADVDYIRSHYDRAARNGRILADKFGVTCGQIHDVVHYVVWAKGRQSK